MTTLFRSLTRVLRIGKEKYLVGHDLNNNAYYELPSRSGSNDPRHTRRTIFWREKLDFSEYDQSSLPVQWKMWLRHTRRSPPTIQELQQDLQRIRLTQHNASILAARDEESRKRFAASNSPPSLSSPQDYSNQDPSSSPCDVWQASKARIQAQDSAAYSAGVQPQPTTENPSFATESGMGIDGKLLERNSEFSSALFRREIARREKERKGEYETKERERREWLLRKSVLEDFDFASSLDLNPSTSTQVDFRSYPSLESYSNSGRMEGGETPNFQAERSRQAEEIQKTGKDRGLGLARDASRNRREGRPGVPSGDWEPKEWSPGVAKRTG